MLGSSLFTACQQGGSGAILTGPANIPPEITNQIFMVAEDATNGTAIGIVTASDDNVITNYAITNDNTTFVIGSNGQLTLITNLNYSTTSNYSLAVQVIDNEGATTFAIITVNVTDVDYPPEITNQIFMVAEDATNGMIIGMVTASDDNRVTRYIITNGNTRNTFALSINGELTVCCRARLWHCF